MRIHDQNILGSTETAQAQETQRVDRAASGRSARPEPGTDRVELSSALGRLSQVISAHGAQRADRVHALATEYQAGRYRPDTQETSRGMIREAIAARD